jgi:hypothetical protein
MGFMDKVKATIKTGAEQAATKAQEELERLQTKRELGQAYADLGEKAFELVDRGELSHTELAGLIDRVRKLRGQLEAIGTAEASAPGEGRTEEPPAS